MIVREWRARASNERASIYAAHFTAAVIPKLRGLEGFVAATLCSRNIDGQIEFVVMSRWTSFASIRAFAGLEIEKAVVEPAAAAALLSYDSVVQHYEITVEAKA